MADSNSAAEAAAVPTAVTKTDEQTELKNGSNTSNVEGTDAAKADASLESSEKKDLTEVKSEDVTKTDESSDRKAEEKDEKRNGDRRNGGRFDRDNKRSGGRFNDKNRFNKKQRYIILHVVVESLSDMCLAGQMSSPTSPRLMIPLRSVNRYTIDTSCTTRY
jgi:hypothetical protein